MTELVEHGPKPTVDFETLKANLQRKIEATTLRLYQDADGYEIIEQNFDDGSKVLMHAAQFNAICLTIARSPQTAANVLYVAGEGPKPEGLR